MGFLWTAELNPGTTTTPDELEGAGVGRQFEDQASAEAWLGEYYEDLADLGVSSVTLMNGEELVYGPMSLEAM
ncbi:hypothetical protein ACTQ49_04250 [Luteococcus sp. Sow4_B9]|uniref:hypothetical protein n=1 Tax=Luteococcus sp. Sow4_B9 TaxID=3438792 RepID=UPI003F987A9A